MAIDANGYDDLSDFTKESRTFNGKTKTVYYQGSGPGVVVMTEMPGIQPTVADFARRVVDLGCTVAMPSLFGDDGRRASSGYAMKSILKGCVTREFAAFSRKKSPPVATWMQALCRDLHSEVGGPGVGLIGMCWTGGFALATMVDPVVVAPVLSQPSLPLAITKKHKAALHLSAADLQIVKERANNGCSVLGLRFSNDGMSPGNRFATLEAELGEGFIGVEIDSGPGNPNDLSHRAHSVVTEHLQDVPGHPTRDALDQVLDLFRERLELSA
jgi:dienelactone hydrolase